MKITIDRAVLDQALEALRYCRATVASVETERRQAIAGLQEALAQPQQEPVAEVQVKMTGGNAGIATVIRELYDPLREPLQPGAKLYTSPPARKPLTDEQWLSVGRQARDAFFGCKQDSVLGQIDCAAHAAIRAVEAAHGIKDTPC